VLRSKERCTVLSKLPYITSKNTKENINCVTSETAELTEMSITSVCMEVIMHLQWSTQASFVFRLIHVKRNLPRQVNHTVKEASFKSYLRTGHLVNLW